MFRKYLTVVYSMKILSTNSYDIQTSEIKYLILIKLINKNMYHTNLPFQHKRKVTARFLIFLNKCFCICPQF